MIKHNGVEQIQTDEGGGPEREMGSQFRARSGSVLSILVGRACDKFFEKRGIKTQDFNRRTKVK